MDLIKAGNVGIENSKPLTQQEQSPDHETAK